MQYEYLEKKLALKPKTLDDNDDDDDDGDVERRSKRRWQPTKDIVEQKEKIRILLSLLIFYLPFSMFPFFFLFFG